MTPYIILGQPDNSPTKIQGLQKKITLKRGNSFGKDCECIMFMKTKLYTCCSWDVLNLSLNVKSFSNKIEMFTTVYSDIVAWQGNGVSSKPTFHRSRLDKPTL